MLEARSRIEPPAQDMKVFWFFSSEKNFLPLTFPDDAPMRPTRAPH
jgi:hypothetical protein